MLNAMPPLRVRGIPVSFETSVDLMTLGFAILLGLACGLVFGIAPALQLARLDAQQALRSGASTPPRSRLRNTLMAVEVALAVTVLVAAGMFLRNFMATRNEDPGFRRQGVLLAGYDLSGRKVTETSTRLFAASLLERLDATPGIEEAAIAAAVPLDIHGLPMRFFTLEGRARPADSPDQALTNTVTPGYFTVMGLPFVAGRDFVELRDEAAPLQAVVNQEFVRRYLDGGDPIGRRIETRGKKYAIAGVVKTSLYNAFGEPPTPMIYFSYRDRPSATGEIHLRTRVGAETSVANDVRAIVRDLDPELPVYDVRTLSDHIEANLIFRRIPARMFAVLGPLLLLLAAIGIYAVVAYAVTLQDVGDRRATRARRHDAPAHRAVRGGTPAHRRRGCACRLADRVRGRRHHAVGAARRRRLRRRSRAAADRGRGGVVVAGAPRRARRSDLCATRGVRPAVIHGLWVLVRMLLGLASRPGRASGLTIPR